MTFSVGPQADGWKIGVYHYESEIASAHYPLIRMFTAASTVAGKPQTDVAGRWEVTSPETAGRFSAAGYFFSLNLLKAIDEPVGLIYSSWGGTPAESWTSLPTLQADAAYADILEGWRKKDDAYPTAMAQYYEALHAWERSAQQAGRWARTGCNGSGGGKG